MYHLTRIIFNLNCPTMSVLTKTNHVRHSLINFLDFVPNRWPCPQGQDKRETSLPQHMAGEGSPQSHHTLHRTGPCHSFIQHRCSSETVSAQKPYDYDECHIPICPDFFLYVFMAELWSIMWHALWIRFMGCPGPSISINYYCLFTTARLIADSAPHINTIVLVGCLLLLTTCYLLGVDSNNPPLASPGSKQRYAAICMVCISSQRALFHAIYFHLSYIHRHFD